MKSNFVRDMVAAYLECAAWSTAECDDEGQDLGSLEDYTFSATALKQAAEDCQSFYDLAQTLLTEADLDAEQAGHDFWLTREGHGAGFWDRGLGEVGEELSDIAKSFGSGDLYKGDDDLLYFG